MGKVIYVDFRKDEFKDIKALKQYIIKYILNPILKGKN